MKLLELKKIINALPDDSVVTVNNDGLSLHVTSNYMKDKKTVFYHGLFIGMKDSHLIWIEVDKKI